LIYISFTSLFASPFRPIFLHHLTTLLTTRLLLAVRD